LVASAAVSDAAEQAPALLQLFVFGES